MACGHCISKYSSYLCSMKIYERMQMPHIYSHTDKRAYRLDRDTHQINRKQSNLRMPMAGHILGEQNIAGGLQRLRWSQILFL